jgi:hypothetical protein
MDNLGYGRYLVSAGTGMTGGFSGLDPNAVLGIFTYQYTPAPLNEGRNTHREIDALEVLRGANSNAQFMLQPYDSRPPGLFFNIPPSVTRITVTLDWGQKVAKFAVYQGQFRFDTLPTPDKALAHLDATNAVFKDLIPAYGWERLPFNLWLMHGRQPTGRQEVVIDGFEYRQPGT